MQVEAPGPAKKISGSRPDIFRGISADCALRDLVAVGASPGARAVVLDHAVPAGCGISRCRNGVDDGERERESQSNLGQHGHSPRVEAGNGLRNEVIVECGKRFAGFAVIGANLRQTR